MPEIIDESGRVRRTDAKREDIFEFLRKNEVENKNRYSLPAVIWDYPETLVETLKAFVEIWNIPEGSIPSKRIKSKKNQGKFSNWVLQLENMNKLFSSTERMRLAMKYAYDKYQASDKRFVIYQPSSIQNLLVDAISELRSQEKTKIIEKPKVIEKYVSKEEVRKKLGNILKNEEA